MCSSRPPSTWGHFSLKSGHVSLPQRLAGLVKSNDWILQDHKNDENGRPQLLQKMASRPMVMQDRRESRSCQRQDHGVHGASVMKTILYGFLLHKIKNTFIHKTRGKNCAAATLIILHFWINAKKHPEKIRLKNIFWFNSTMFDGS